MSFDVSTLAFWIKKTDVVYSPVRLIQVHIFREIPAEPIKIFFEQAGRVYKKFDESNCPSTVQYQSGKTVHVYSHTVIMYDADRAKLEILPEICK